MGRRPVPKQQTLFTHKVAGEIDELIAVMEVSGDYVRLEIIPQFLPNDESVEEIVQALRKTLVVRTSNQRMI